jgi:REP element-mobilizing transposase RayT
MRFHGQDLRKGRVSIPGHAYLLTAVIQNRTPIFHDWPVACLMSRALHRMGIAENVDSLAWVVMPDHFHWLIQLRAGALGALMQRLKSTSAISINGHLGQSQRLWQKGFHDRAVRTEEDLQAIARYVVGNPIRAGLCSKVGDYPFWNAVWL